MQLANPACARHAPSSRSTTTSSALLSFRCNPRQEECTNCAALQRMPSRHQLWRQSQQHQKPLIQCSSQAATTSPDMLADVAAPKRRRLIIMRHADSDERNRSQRKDNERTITELGKQAAAQTAQLLHQHGWLPGMVLSSNSERTRQTLDAMKEAVDAFRHAETHFKGSFYTIAALDGMTRKHLQNVIVDACRQSVHECVLCLGHNKGWEEAASSFAGSPVRLETANAALLEGVGDTWADAFAQEASWKLVGVLTP